MNSKFNLLDFIESPDIRKCYEDSGVELDAWQAAQIVYCSTNTLETKRNAYTVIYMPCVRTKSIYSTYNEVTAEVKERLIGRDSVEHTITVVKHWLKKEHPPAKLNTTMYMSRTTTFQKKTNAVQYTESMLMQYWNMRTY